MVRVRRHIPFLITGLMAGLLVASGPQLARAAQQVVNADKVDGKHAVSAGASPKQRANKLVAADKRGRLPDNIIAKAPDADLLDGKSSAAFSRTGHDHDDRYYTRAEADSAVSSRLVAVGLMDSGGTLSDPHTSGPVSGSRVGTGVYNLVLPGLRPGCTGDQPVFTGTPFVVGAWVTVNGVSCSEGTVTITVVTYIGNGSFYDTTFYFTIYGP